MIRRINWPESFAFFMRIAHERKHTREEFIAFAQDLQDQTRMACSGCGLQWKSRILRTADLNAFYELVQRASSQKLEKGVFRRYRRFHAECPRCGKESKLQEVFDPEKASAPQGNESVSALEHSSR